VKRRGPKHTAGEKELMRQVRDEFAKKKRELGARQAARELNVCLASFYKYAAGEDLPRVEVLRDAQEKWGIKWKLIDPREMLQRQKISSPEQLVFTSLGAIRAQDVDVAKIKPQGTILEMTLRIRFTA
jgi:hypothetical protein